ncbi:HET-domain-containing protein, partial [Decorospora gaudefroyi]
WISNCLRYHERCCTESLFLGGMRLIDCQMKQIIDAKPCSRWVALSYVWGSETTTPRQWTHNGGRYPWPSDIPRTVTDTMVVTVETGYRYLWCEAYCIDQEDVAHKADQISKMGKIYRCADFAIVATGPNKHHGLPGVSSSRVSEQQKFHLPGRDLIYMGPDPLYTILQSTWMERAWTFQGGYLSKRLLVL